MAAQQITGDNNMLLVGVGNAGGRAAYYVFQRGSLPGLRICAMDSDEEALQRLSGLNTVKLPSPPESDDNPETDLSVLHAALEAQFPTIHLLLVLTGLGGRTGCYYTLETLRYARSKKLACAAIVAMPHSFDSPDLHTRAETGLRQLREITPAVQLLPCQEFGSLFLDKSREEAYPQAARWLAESSIGFLYPFAKFKTPKRVASKSNRKGDPNQLTFVFNDQPRGIFTGGLPSNYNGQNLDIPTYQRLNADIDPGE
jgi:cell division GTPase FtsZ